MNNFEKSETYKNLARSFAGECQAGARYQFLAKKCKDEKYCFLERTLKTIAKNEMTHGKIFYDHITENTSDLAKNIEICAGYPFKCGTITEEFLYSLENEKSEEENIYPSFARVATDEGYPEIANSFNMVAGVEKCHKELLEQLWTKLKNSKLYKSTKSVKWKCGQCGYEENLKEAWQVCPLCGAQQGEVEVHLDTES